MKLTMDTPRESNPSEEEGADLYADADLGH